LSQVFTVDDTYQDVDYTSSFVTADANERVSMFYPEGSPSDYGWSGSVWPCLTWVENSGFSDGSIPTEITGPANTLWHFLVRGIAVAYATTVQVENEGSGGPNGAGVFRPPGETDPNYDQWSDGDYPCTQKSCIHLIQYLKDQAASLLIDPDMICMGGRSGGSMGPSWCGLGTDWSTYTGSSGQFRAGISTRPAAVISMQSHAWIRAFVTSQAFKVLPSSSSPLTNYANTISASPSSPDVAKETSSMYFGFDETKYPGVQALNATQPIYLYSTDDIGVNKFILDGDDLPLLTNTLEDDHDGWFLAVLWHRLLILDESFHARRSRMMFTQGKEPSQAAVPYVRSMPNIQDIYADMAEWFLGIAQSQPYDEPVSEKIIRNVETTLLGIDKGTGYFTTVRSVSRDDVATVDTSKAPLAVVLPTSTDMDGVSETLTSTIRHEMRCMVGLVLKDRSDAVRDMERFIRDATEALYSDRTRAGLATNTVVQGVTRTYPEGDQSAVYVAWLEVVINFRTEEADLSAAV